MWTMHLHTDNEFIGLLSPVVPRYRSATLTSAPQWDPQVAMKWVNNKICVLTDCGFILVNVVA